MVAMAMIPSGGPFSGGDHPMPAFGHAGGHGIEHDSVEAIGDLLLACAEGSHEAFSRLYDRISARVFGLVLRVVRDRAQAEEVTQEVLIDVWRQADRYDPARGSAMGWILTMTHRRAVDRVRSAQSSTVRDTTYEQRQIEPEIDSTSEQAHRNIEAERVRAALSELSSVQRGALELAYFGGLSHREVAARLDLPVGTAKTRIRDGLIRLRALLADHAPESSAGTTTDAVGASAHHDAPDHHDTTVGERP